MAIFHLHAQIIKRSSGRSAVAAAAYRAGEKMHNDYDGITHDYTRKSGVVHKEILLPEHAPKEYLNRSILWNAVEKVEKRKDAQTAREIDIALPIEFDRTEQIEISRKYIQDNFIDKGMCADLVVHDKQDGNPHAHIMLTTREITTAGFGGKNREWNDKVHLEEWRGNWALACNEKLQSKGFDERIDHRTLKEQGIEREPTIHIGATAKKMEKAGRDSDRVKEYKEIMSQNKTVLLPEITAEYMHELKQAYIILEKEIAGFKRQAAATQREAKALQFRAEEITERTELIQTMKDQLNGLQTRRQGMRLFENKSDIDNQIGQLELSHEQATSYFWRNYYIAPEEAAAEVKRLEYKIKDFERVSERFQDSLAPLTAERDSFMLEYQRRKLIAEISLSGQKIQEELKRLDKELMQGQSAQYKLAYMRSERALEVITEQSLQRILDDLQPEQQYKLIKIYEREREREHAKNRYR